MKLVKKTMIAIAVSSVFTASAYAGDLSYNYANLNYLSNSASGLSGSGFGVDASFDIANNVNLFAGYDAPSFSGTSVTEFKVGVGFHQSMSPNGDWYAKFDYRNFKNIFAVTFNGYAISGGARAALSDKFEMDGYFGYADYEGYNGLIFGIDGTYKITDSVGITAGYMSNDDAVGWTGFKVGARMYF